MREEVVGPYQVEVTERTEGDWVASVQGPLSRFIPPATAPSREAAFDACRQGIVEYVTSRWSPDRPAPKILVEMADR